jgi:hypothetical protein
MRRAAQEAELMRIQTFSHPGEISSLLAQLVAYDVELPAGVTEAGAQLARIHGLAPTLAVPTESLIGRSDDELATIIRDLGIASSMRRTESFGVIQEVANALAGDIAGLIYDGVDAILDQLRPAFEEAAETMHAATAMGLGPETTPDDILRAENVAEVRDMWATVPQAARILDGISRVRMLLSTAVGVPPDTTTSFANPEGLVDAVGIFTQRPRRLHLDGEDGWQRWLRLCADEPVRLLAVSS